MFQRKTLIFVTIAVLAILSLSCSSSGLTPANNGGNPENTDYPSRVMGYVTLDDNPVAEAEVAVYNVTDGSLVGNYTTGADGKYRLNPVGGQYIMICIHQDGYGEPVYLNLANDNSEHQMNIRIRRYEGENRGAIFCRVINEDNSTPIANARVRFEGHEGYTDAWGFCFMPGIPERNEYKFDVQAKGFSGRVHEIRTGQFDRTLILRAESFKLSPATGDLASLFGAVRNIATGIDLGGAFVTLSRPGDPDFRSVTYMTNLGGVYRFYNLQRGTYTLKAERTGFMDETHQVIINEEEGFFNIFLTPDVAQLATIQGLVRDQTGTMPLPNVNVYISNPLFGMQRSTISDGLGRFSFSGLVFGDYYISANHPTTLFLPAGTPISLIQEEHEIQLNLPFNNSGAIIGTVTVAGYDGFPTGAKVTAEKVGGEMSGLKFESNVDAYGKYAINGVLAGAYKVTVEVNYAENKKATGVAFNIPVNAGAATVRDFEIASVH